MVLIWVIMGHFRFLVVSFVFVLGMKNDQKFQVHFESELVLCFIDKKESLFCVHNKLKSEGR